MKQKPAFTRHRFTIVEALSSAVILGLTGAGFVSLMLFSTEVADLMDRRQRCMQLAVRRIEEIRNRPFTEVSFFVEDGVRINELGNADADGQYQRTTTVKTVEADVSCIVSVVVTGEGTGRQGDTKYELSTVIIDYDQVHGQHD